MRLSVKNVLLPSVLIVTTIFCSNCAKSQYINQALSPSISSGDSTNSVPTAPGIPGFPVDPVSQLDFKGRVESSDGNNNALAFDFDKTRGEFIIMIPMPSGILFSPSGTFSRYPDISFSPIIDSSGRMKFAVRVPIKYVIKGASFLPASRLPNGDALPAMPAGYGELPSLGLTFPQQNNTQITLYIGINAVGLFVGLPDIAALPFGFTLPIKNSAKTKTLGFLSYVPKKGTFAPGLFVSSLIPPSMARILEDNFHL